MVNGKNAFDSAALAMESQGELSESGGCDNEWDQNWDHWLDGDEFTNMDLPWDN